LSGPLEEKKNYSRLMWSCPRGGSLFGREETKALVERAGKDKRGNGETYAGKE